MEKNSIYTGKITLALEENGRPIIFSDSFTGGSNYINYNVSDMTDGMPYDIASHVYRNISEGYDLDIVEGEACVIPIKNDRFVYAPLSAACDGRKIYPVGEKFKKEFMDALKLLRSKSD